MTLDRLTNRLFTALAVTALAVSSACSVLPQAQATVMTATPTETPNPTFTPTATYTPTASPTPTATATATIDPSAWPLDSYPGETGRYILVDLSEQTAYAMVQFGSGVEEAIHYSLASTGSPDTPTPIGDFWVWIKFLGVHMSGPGYDWPSVPNTLFMYNDAHRKEEGYAVHGSYWQSIFGVPMSYGCVNLPIGDSESLDESQWFYEFAEVGTLVRVQD